MVLAQLSKPCQSRRYPCCRSRRRAWLYLLLTGFFCCCDSYACEPGQHDDGQQKVCDRADHREEHRQHGNRFGFAGSKAKGTAKALYDSSGRPPTPIPVTPSSYPPWPRCGRAPETAKAPNNSPARQPMPATPRPWRVWPGHEMRPVTSLAPCCSWRNRWSFGALTVGRLCLRPAIRLPPGNSRARPLTLATPGPCGWWPSDGSWTGTMKAPKILLGGGPTPGAAERWLPSPCAVIFTATSRKLCACASSPLTPAALLLW